MGRVVGDVVGLGVGVGVVVVRVVGFGGFDDCVLRMYSKYSFVPILSLFSGGPSEVGNPSGSGLSGCGVAAGVAMS